jgi:hypothetical protein
MYTVTVKSVSGRTTHSTHHSFRAAALQAEMLHGRVEGERDAFAWARASQGFGGTFEEWMSQDNDERGAFERGAAGIPTA